MAIRVITKTWLDSHGDPSIEKTLSNAQVMEGMLQVLFISNDDEVLELIISILAEFSMRNDTKNSNPQLVIFLRLRSSSLFLKAPPDLLRICTSMRRRRWSWLWPSPKMWSFRPHPRVGLERLFDVRPNEERRR
ncbi:hypothetical protein RHMOL_Rhmol05G0179900 [Rhododendron molle]|uniref:Uncharacterized protein n=1 Tax=Rhododendron molle TaxID=49168 RepID=A0ACC0NRI2_RHOML|nr:hypothetical protein RHMOL_Rhmol05G0179900 [Rhododendron molle]